MAPAAANAADASLRQEAERALRKAVDFYRNRVSTEGGYHFSYAEDLSYGRSEQSEGPTIVEVQREGTPVVGMAYLEAYAATGDRFYLDAARQTANALVRGQLCSGGWDYSIEFDPVKRKQLPYRADGNCGPGSSVKGPGVTTLDDNVTQACARLMMRVDKELNFQDPKIHEASLFVLDSLIKAQYPNGAWPQRYTEFPDPAKHSVKKASYPDKWSWEWPGPNYRGHYTFNDNAVPDVIDMFLEAARIYRNPKYLAAAERGGNFILMAQMPDPQPAWAQQYDADMHPAWARIFEPPSVTGGESQGVMRILLVLYQETGDRKYIEPLPKALKYLLSSTIPRSQSPSEIWLRVARQGEPVLARFYELRTNRPLYVTKGTRVYVKNRSSELVDGYKLTYSDASVITHYNVLTSGRELPEIEADYRRIAAADPAKLKRPDRLCGLSPWDDKPQPPRPPSDLEAEVRRIVAGMDPRGAWVQEGTIGKADRLLSVFAARPMVLTIGSRVIPIEENDDIDLFQGPKPPRERIIRSRTFARNVEILSEYLAGR